ncbi:MAG: S-methyl-5-thioribose-1-phosphate isomerase [Candidatus Edwardsbacteria bacterium]|nr:S-methyl-5-thioribose-1-phosphate isomerase [Candidatus Edwardsbacteria bacterium]
MQKVLAWRNGTVRLLDQRRLPLRAEYLVCRKVEDLALAIEGLAVRGAPLIGIAGAYGLVLGIWRSGAENISADFRKSYLRIKKTRPTAVNIFWALDRMEARFNSLIMSGGPAEAIKKKLLQAARGIHAEDAVTCGLIGRQGASLLGKDSVIITHCNTGALATGGIGTALGIISTAYKMGRVGSVYVDETRPLLQGARLTAWELARLKIPAVLICDNMAASLMASGKIDCAIVGADRICANGDFANKIGTYSLAVNARHHGVPFYVAAPLSTFDRSLKDGSRIPIEQRNPDEVRRFGQCRAAPGKMAVFNPSFDVTPGKLVSAIITEKGVIRPPFGRSIKAISG